MAGSEINQKRKKHMKSLVVVPDDSGRLLAGVVWVSMQVIRRQVTHVYHLHLARLLGA